MQQGCRRAKAGPRAAEGARNGQAATAPGVRRRAQAAGGIEFADLDQLDIVGIYPNYRTAYQAWRSAAQKTVDEAHMRYFIVHLFACSTQTLIDRRSDAARGPQELRVWAAEMPTRSSP